MKENLRTKVESWLVANQPSLGVTNAEYARFVEATGYVTAAEWKPDWEELKKQLPPGTPKTG